MKPSGPETILSTSLLVCTFLMNIPFRSTTTSWPEELPIQILPSEPVVNTCNPPNTCGNGSENSVMVPDSVILPTFAGADPFVYQRAPSGPTAIPPTPSDGLGMA